MGFVAFVDNENHKLKTINQKNEGRLFRTGDLDAEGQYVDDDVALGFGAWEFY